MRLLFLAGALAACGSHGAPAEQAPARPPVLVTIVVDQLPAWAALEKVPLLPDDGGFARLRREGTWMRDVRYAHAMTHTGPGHAALYTGRPPVESGIGTDTVLAADGEEVSAYRTDGVHLVTEDGAQEAPGSSPARLRVGGVADWLRATRPHAFIVGLSLKDRGAIIPAGRAPDAAIWFEPKQSSFVTSTAYGTALPAWARGLADRRAVARARSGTWEPVDAAWLAAHAATPDQQAGEVDYNGLAVAFPHRAGGEQADKAFRATPFADQVVLALARAAIDVAPRDQPVLLALSMSAHDYVGHVFGPDSWEAWDELRRLDAALGELMRHLDGAFGAEGWSMMLSSDHGVAPIPEAPCRVQAGDRWQRTCGPDVCHRLLRKPLTGRLEKVAAAALSGGGPWVAGVVEPFIVLSEAARALPPERAAVLNAALIAELERDPAVARVYEVAATSARARPKAGDESIDALVERSLAPGDWGELYVLTRPCCFFDPDMDDEGLGANHGTPYLYDRAVPLFVRAPGRFAAGAVVDEPRPFTVFARTAAELLGIAPR